jgi:hypothetical protein
MGPMPVLVRYHDRHEGGQRQDAYFVHVFGPTLADGFLPRHRGPLASPIAKDSASRSRSSASRRLRSALASSVSLPCLCCGWFRPRLTVSGLRAPCRRQTRPELPQATTAGFLHLAPECLARAVHCLTVSPTPGSGMSVSLHYTWREAAATGANFNRRIPQASRGLLSVLSVTPHPVQHATTS